MYSAQKVIHDKFLSIFRSTNPKPYSKLVCNMADPDFGLDRMRR